MSWSLVNEQLVFANQRLIGRVTTLHIQTITGQWVSDKNGGFITIAIYRSIYMFVSVPYKSPNIFPFYLGHSVVNC